MPTIIEVEGYKVLVYTHDHLPPHVHVRKDGAEIRVLIGREPSLWSVTAGDPNTKTIRRAVGIVADHLATCNTKWSEIHGHFAL